MARKPTKHSTPGDARRPTGRKVPMTFRLPEEKIAAAQKILGTPTATATIEMALDMVVFRQELLDGLAGMRGVRLSNIPDDELGANA